jgi:hypothetical protein
VTAALWLLGSLAFDAGDYARAELLFDECLAAGRVLGDPTAVAMALRYLAGVRYLRNDLAEAVPMLREALLGCPASIDRNEYYR